MGDYDVHEVLAMLQKYYISESPQMVTKWIRDGKIQGFRTENRKLGYRVSEDALFDYIEEIRPGLPAIMEVYEEHIKRLRHNQLEESKHTQNEETSEIKKIFEAKEKQYEKELDELHEVVRNLENTNIELQQEKQMIEMNIIEIIEKNDKLIEEKSALVDENKTLTELYEIIDEEMRVIKNTQFAPVVSEEGSRKRKENVESSAEDKSIKFTLDEFKKIGMDVVLKFDLKMEKTKVENQLTTIYENIFENGFIKAEMVKTDGTFKCPYTEKEYKQVKRLINNAIKFSFESLEEQPDREEQVEITMANEQ